MLKVTVRNNITFPSTLIDQEDLEHVAKDIIIKDLEKHIDLRASIDLGALPFNEPETVKRKGHAHQLFETGELRKSFFHRVAGKAKVIVNILSGRADIGKYLQDGIMAKGRLKQYIFFGVSDFAEEEALKYLMERLESKLGNSGSKR